MSQLVARFFMENLLKPERIADKALQPSGKGEDESNKWKKDQLGVELQRWVGAMEIILYASSLVFGYPGFIAVWFATKYIPVWRTWSEDPVARTFFNRSLFGSGLNIVLGVATGGIARLAISHIG